MLYPEVAWSSVLSCPATTMVVATEARATDGQRYHCERGELVSVVFVDATKPTMPSASNVAIVGGNSENATDKPINTITQTPAIVGSDPVTNNVAKTAIAIVPTAAAYVKLPVIAITIAVQATTVAHATTLALKRVGGASADGASEIKSNAIQVVMQTMVIALSPIVPLVRSRM